MADVLVEPAQGLNLVKQPIVPLSGLITGTEEAWVIVETKIDVGRRQGRDKDRWEKNKRKEDIEEGGMQRQEENKERRERLD